MRTHSIAALVLAAILALSACSDDDPDPGDPMSTWTPSGTPDAPSSSATPSADPTEPPLPDAAREATEAGARAFITYYFDLISFAQVTGDVRALKAASGPTCDGCNAGIIGVQQHYRDGGQIDGGALGVRVDRISELSTKSSSLYGFRATATSTHEQQTVIGADGTEEVRQPGTNRWDLYLLWTPADRWRLDVMELK